MITYQEALRRANKWINAERSPDSQVKVGIYEFDDGFVVWPRWPKPDDLTEPADESFGGVGVIDRETGQLSGWPNRPPRVIAASYSRRKRGEDVAWRE